MRKQKSGPRKCYSCGSMVGQYESVKFLMPQRSGRDIPAVMHDFCLVRFNRLATTKEFAEAFFRLERKGSANVA